MERMGTPDQRLVRAAKSGHLAGVNDALWEKASPSARGPMGISALTLAGANGWMAVMDRLIRAGADVNQRDEERMTPLERLIQAQSGKAPIQRIIEAGASLEGGVADKAMRWAIESGAEEVAKALIKRKVETGKQGHRWLELAIKKDRPRIAKMLIAAKVDLSKRTESGESAPHWATRWALDHDDTKLIERVWKAGGKMDAKSRKGETPLILARKHDGRGQKARGWIMALCEAIELGEAASKVKGKELGSGQVRASRRRL